MSMAKLGNIVAAFDISENGIEKAKKIARQMGVQVNFYSNLIPNVYN